METDFRNILFALIASRYIGHDTLRAPPILPGELGGHQVPQSRVCSVVVVVIKRCMTFFLRGYLQTRAARHIPS